MRRILLTFIFIITAQSVFAQGDGPHSYLLAPVGVTGINAKYIQLKQNFTSSDIFIPGAEIDISAYPITLYHTFSIKGAYAQGYVMVNPSSFTATSTTVPLVFPIPIGTQVKANGLSDGFAALRIGLFGTPALKPSAFIEEDMRFSIFADARCWFSGTYDTSKYVNLGSNRNTIQLSLPMAIPLNKNRERATWLEVSPSVEFFTANNQPSKGNKANKITQAPILILENHLSHNFSKKIWATVGLRFRQGGTTSTDGEKNDNQTQILGTSAGLGYQFKPFLGFLADYGTVLYGYNGAESNMLRISLSLNYANMKKP